MVVGATVACTCLALATLRQNGGKSLGYETDGRKSLLQLVKVSRSLCLSRLRLLRCLGIASGSDDVLIQRLDVQSSFSSTRPSFDDTYAP